MTHQKKRPILVSPSKTRIPVGVSPRLYSDPSLPRTVCMSTPYISRLLAFLRKFVSDWAGDMPRCLLNWSKTSISNCSFWLDTNRNSDTNARVWTPGSKSPSSAETENKLSLVPRVSRSCLSEPLQCG